MSPILHDAVTLRHFAAVEAMAVLEERHSHRSEPRWSDAIRAEIAAAARAGETHCSDILTESWLGPAPAPDTRSAHSAVYRIQVGLNDGRQPPDAHLGEAEGIYFAEQTGGDFATDDNGAYEFAKRRPTLGPARVVDTIDILRSAVAFGETSPVRANEIADLVESVGRFLRPVHRHSRGPEYFH